MGAVGRTVSHTVSTLTGSFKQVFTQPGKANLGQFITVGTAGLAAPTVNAYNQARRGNLSDAIVTGVGAVSLGAGIAALAPAAPAAASVGGAGANLAGIGGYSASGNLLDLPGGTVGAYSPTPIFGTAVTPGAAVPGTTAFGGGLSGFLSNVTAEAKGLITPILGLKAIDSLKGLGAGNTNSNGTPAGQGGFPGFLSSLFGNGAGNAAAPGTTIINPSTPTGAADTSTSPMTLIIIALIAGLLVFFGPKLARQL